MGRSGWSVIGGDVVLVVIAALLRLGWVGIHLESGLQGFMRLPLLEKEIMQRHWFGG